MEGTIKIPGIDRLPDGVVMTGVVGFDNHELGGSHGYSLTTYEQPRHEMVRAIIAMILGTVEAETVTLPGKLVIRNST